MGLDKNLTYDSIFLVCPIVSFTGDFLLDSFKNSSNVYGD